MPRRETSPFQSCKNSKELYSILTTTNFFHHDELTMHDEIRRRRRRGALGQISRQAAGGVLGARGRKGRGAPGVSPRWTTHSIFGKRGYPGAMGSAALSLCYSGRSRLLTPLLRNPPFGGPRREALGGGKRKVIFCTWGVPPWQFK